MKIANRLWSVNGQSPPPVEGLGEASGSRGHPPELRNARDGPPEVNRTRGKPPELKTGRHHSFKEELVFRILGCKIGRMGEVCPGGKEDAIPQTNRHCERPQGVRQSFKYQIASYLAMTGNRALSFAVRFSERT